ncbi:DUF294 nucleotidyltransferase-like domain-containing protein [Candidatus Margulisiibacteriota bacterium]
MVFSEKEREELINNLQTTLILSGQPLPNIKKEMQKAKTPDQIYAIRKRFPLAIKTLIEYTSDARNITGLTSALADEVISGLVKIAMKELGKPPAKFSFIVMGSEGRVEQTLKTDQDNAIIYDDNGQTDQDSLRAYFLELGQKVCDWLDQLGYPYCKGGMMAKNEKWCKPLSVWKHYFRDWIVTADPETLIKSKIFFDFRPVYGEEGLSQELRNSLFQDIDDKATFFWQLAKTMLLFRPPLGLFGNIQLESEGEHKAEFSIKKAITPIVDIARIYALKNCIFETNTSERLSLLFEKGILNRIDYQDILEVYQYLMQLRLRYQAEAIANNTMPDNYLNPKHIPKLDRLMLKESFLIIESFQTKMSLDFTGGADI